ncbi:helix-turn-helix domain-containing protein [Kitasatospora kifunensis]|uniref:Transcriptional regulator with XRE-family HTH domain n=1 Tax=Kitasatospora kifunensis TaxID=58351 RepID=A0A7W7R5X5_KITKI|nr:helix-turn-helix transcriptional regulator [Kitasatospora kifunensis]MBB4925895.1 transcriptional regulator with XRE-family HTH domain [Kitasatospora kifunensis]
MTVADQDDEAQAAAPELPEQRPEAPEDPDDSTEFFRAIGKQLKLLRERQKLTQKQVADILGYSEDLVSSLERGRRVPQKDYLLAVDKLLKAGGVMTVTQEEIEKAQRKAKVRHPSWFRDYALLEAQAIERHEYSTHDLPGLLQTEEHARAMFSARRPLLAEATIEERVSARMARQKILEGWPLPDASWIIEEAVLRRPIGGRDVHRHQLEKLLRIGRTRSLEIQVMPTDRPEHSGMSGPFVLLTPKGKPQLGYIEVQNFSHLTKDPEEVRILAAQYGSLRALALTPSESLALIEKMLGEL